MKAIRLYEYGGPEVLRFEDLPTPMPEAGQALVRIEAAGVNFIDLNQRLGVGRPPTFPQPLGLEGAGVVEAVGPATDGVRVGDRVAWQMLPGSYATHAALAADRLITLPDGVGTRTAAAATLQGLTAHCLTHTTYPIARGDTCLVHAAAGGVGLFVTQMAKMRGARVIATVSSEEKARAARAAGADEVIVHTQADFVKEVERLTGGRGVDVVYDGVGKDTFDKSFACLRPAGYMVFFGSASGPVGPFDLARLNPRSLTLARCNVAVLTAAHDDLLRRARDVFGWIAAGKLAVRIGKRYALRDAPAAHRDLASRATIGKLLLEPAG